MNPGLTEETKLVRQIQQHPYPLMLYVYRVLLTGIHLMRTGEVEANLIKLNQEARLPYIDDLVQQKTTGQEKQLLAATDLDFHQREYDRLMAELENAMQQSHLPEHATAAPALNNLLLRVRKTTQ